MTRKVQDDAILDRNKAAAVVRDIRDHAAVRPRTEPAGAPFHGILFDRAGQPLVEQEPSCFGDLNLDQIVEGATGGREQYALKPIYYTHVEDAGTIAYRQAVFRDLEVPDIRLIVDAFAKAVNRVREQRETAGKLHYPRQKQWLHLDAAATYCEGVIGFVDGLVTASHASAGLRRFERYATAYAGSERFLTLRTTVDAIRADLSEIRYCLHFYGGTITARRFADEIDYSQAVETTFERFKRGAAKDYKAEFHDHLDMNHVEAAVLELVVKLFPAPFAALETFSRDWAKFEDDIVIAFDREVQFFLGYLDYIGRLKSTGLAFCYPAIAENDKTIHCTDAFDLALAHKLLEDEQQPVVTNGFYLKGDERVFVVSGPNQGGKTTFARTFGQLHVLATLGCPVPGTEARLYLFDALYTHFEREENIATLRGKLQDDLVRIHDILERATNRSIVVMNEIFTSTTLSDALFLGKQVMSRILERDIVGVCVTFLDELASLGSQTVSVVSTVAPDDPAQRTYKLVRRPADGRAHAMAIARKHGLADDQLTERLKK